MKLYKKLFSGIVGSREIDKYPEPFKLLLKRLCVMEAVAAIKIAKHQPIYVPEREALILRNISEKCNQYGFDSDKTETIQSFFNNNMTLAKLIQQAYANENKDAPEEYHKIYATQSVCLMLGADINEDDILVSIRNIIDGLTDNIIGWIDYFSDDTSWNLLKQLLEDSFQAINKDELLDVINNFKQLMTTYKQNRESPSVAEIPPLQSISAAPVASPSPQVISLLFSRAEPLQISAAASSEPSNSPPSGLIRSHL